MLHRFGKLVIQASNINYFMQDDDTLMIGFVGSDKPLIIGYWIRSGGSVTWGSDANIRIEEKDFERLNVFLASLSGKA